ncbi:MAG: Flp pilus assembly protein CpaB [Rhodospirillales bacterium]|nr:Flp pilus assembly protein CpaB [Rhodospirillales bacterium]
MKKRAFAMLAIAIVLGLVSVFLVQDWLARQAPPPAPEATLPVTKVVVARSQMTFGTRIRQDLVRLVDWPAGTVPVGAFTSIDELVGKDGERVALRTIEPDEPILASKVSGANGRATLSTVLPMEKRAVTIRVNDVLGVAGFVLPGDRVDVLLTRDQQQRAPVTDILLQNIRVLGVDQDANERKDKPTVARAVTLEVTPAEAQKLTLGSQVGTLSLALRNLSDAEEAPARTIGLRDLGTETPKAKPAVAAAPPTGVSIRILRGTEASNYEVRREFAR